MNTLDTAALESHLGEASALSNGDQWERWSQELVAMCSSAKSQNPSEYEQDWIARLNKQPDEIWVNFSPRNITSLAELEEHVALIPSAYWRYWHAGEYMGVEEATRFAASPAVARVRDLNILGAGLQDDAVKVLFESPNIASAWYIELSHNPIGEEGIRSIAASPHLTNLRELILEELALEPWVSAEILAESETLGEDVEIVCD